MPPAGKYIWNHYRCATCHGYVVSVRAVEGNMPTNLPCQTAGCRGVMASALDAPVVDWPVVIIRTATTVWYRPTGFELRMMKKTNPKLAEAVLRTNRLIIKKLDTPIEWSEDNDGYPKSARFSLT
jgi:hypothetical protein